MCVCNDADYFYQFIDGELRDFGLTCEKDGRPLTARDLVRIVDGYKGLGYAQNTEEELGNDTLSVMCVASIPGRCAAKNALPLFRF